MKKVYIYLGLAVIFIVGITITKGSLEILDSKFFYLKSDIDLLFDSLGETGRASYFIINILDFFFMTFLTLALVKIYKIFFEKDQMYKSLLWIPITYGLADFLETGIIFYLNIIFPNTSETLKMILVVATPVKWFFALSSFLVVINGYILKLYLQKTGSN